MAIFVVCRRELYRTANRAVPHTFGMTAFDRVDVVALDDTHQSKVDSDLRIRLIRAPEFVQKVHLIIVEFANTADQSILDRDRRISEIVAEERARLRNFIRRRLPDPADAVDIVQEVFYELVEANRLLMPIEHVTGWLFRVARNRITRTAKSCGWKT